MEGIGFILIGAALFSHSWYLMELYSEGRAVGVLMAAIGVGLLFTLTFDPQILGTVGADLDKTSDINVMKSLIVMWAVYSFAVAAQGYFDTEEHNVRPIGFFGAVLAIASALTLFYFGTVMGENGRIGDTAVIVFTLASLLLTLVAALLFFYLAIPFRALKPVVGWFMLIGGIIVMSVGLVVTTTIVVA